MTIKYWSCACGYGGNLHYQSTCTSCGAAVPLSPPRHGAPRDHARPQAGAAPASPADQEQVVLTIMRSTPRIDWILRELLDEMDENAGLGVGHRVDLLIERGMIRFTGDERNSAAGEKQRCFVLTPAGAAP